MQDTLKITEIFLKEDSLLTVVHSDYGTQYNQ